MAASKGAATDIETTSYHTSGRQRAPPCTSLRICPTAVSQSLPGDAARMARILTNNFASAMLIGVVRADPPWGGGGGGGWGGNRWGWGGNDGDVDGDNIEYYGNQQNGYGFGDMASFDRANTILIAHAVIASAVWVLFVPWAALLLRINIKSALALKLHVVFQLFSYLLYIIAVGLGIWLAQQSAASGIWNDAHPRLGLAIVGIVLLQTIFGFVHHRMSKKPSAAPATGKATSSPAHTVVGRVHVWVGRSLIVLGIINGGLGIRLAGFTPFRTDAQTRTAGIVYGVVAASMFVLYAVLVLLFQVRRTRAERHTPAPTAYQQMKGLPTYEESQSALSLSTSQTTDTNNVAVAHQAGGAPPRYS